MKNLKKFLIVIVSATMIQMVNAKDVFSNDAFKYEEVLERYKERNKQKADVISDYGFSLYIKNKSNDEFYEFINGKTPNETYKAILELKNNPDLSEKIDKVVETTKKENILFTGNFSKDMSLINEYKKENKERGVILSQFLRFLCSKNITYTKNDTTVGYTTSFDGEKVYKEFKKKTLDEVYQIAINLRNDYQARNAFGDIKLTEDPIEFTKLQSNYSMQNPEKAITIFSYLSSIIYKGGMEMDYSKVAGKTLDEFYELAVEKDAQIAKETAGMTGVFTGNRTKDRKLMDDFGKKNEAKKGTLVRFYIMGLFMEKGPKEGAAFIKGKTPEEIYEIAAKTEKERVAKLTKGRLTPEEAANVFKEDGMPLKEGVKLEDNMPQHSFKRLVLDGSNDDSINPNKNHIAYHLFLRDNKLSEATLRIHIKKRHADRNKKDIDKYIKLIKKMSSKVVNKELPKEIIAVCEKFQNNTEIDLNERLEKGNIKYSISTGYGSCYLSISYPIVITFGK